MSSDSKSPDFIRRLAEQHGLARALELFPDAVQTAAERGLKPLGAPPAGTSRLIQPATQFDPARFEPRE